MTFRDFKAQVNALPAHDLASVPCDGVELNGCDVALPSSAENERIADLESDLADTEEKIVEAGKTIEELEGERDKLRDELDALKDTLADLRDPESGVTLKDMLARTEAAEKKEREWADIAQHNRRLAEADRAELLALRKRKGIDCNLFAHRAEVLTILNTFVGCTPEQAPRLKERAKEVLGKVYAK